ncbi:MAG: YqhA family protein [Snowella sp.]|nr:YqhA family protein [Snowella sp.]
MNFVKSLLFLNRALILLSIFFILITAFSAFVYASVKTAELLWELLTHRWLLEKVEFHFVEVIERFLTAIALLILGMGLYELFIQPLNLPQPLKVNSFHELKSNLGNIILLNMVVIFFGNLAEDGQAKDLLLQAIAIGIISGILILFAQNQDHHASPKPSTPTSPLPDSVSGKE